MIRSWLFVPGDSEKKIARALSSDADAIIIDWEDAVADARKPVARQMLAELLADAPKQTPRLYVRVNALDTPHFAPDMQALPCGLVQGVVLPKLCGPADVDTLARRLGQAENNTGTTAGHLEIVGVATEHASAVLALTEFRQPLPRLTGMMWGGEDLSADLGILNNRYPDGQYKPAFCLARDLMLMAAGAAQCTAIDAVYVEFRNLDGLARECRAAKSMGFTGKAAIHPDQVPVINDAFSPDAEEQEWARRVLNAVDAETGVATLDGKMIDAPHIKLARRILG